MELQETVENKGANLLQHQGNSKDGNSIEKLDRSTALADGCGNKEDKKACRKTLRQCQGPNAKEECTKQIADACDGCLTTVPEYAEYVGGEEKKGSEEHTCPEIAGNYNLGDATTGTIIASMTLTSNTKSFVSGVIESSNMTISGSIYAKIAESCVGVCVLEGGSPYEKKRISFRYTDNVIVWNNGAIWNKIE